MKDLSLVIPAYNEEVRLPTLLEVLSNSAGDAVRAAGFRLAEAILVDDGSSDGTRAALKRAEAEDETIRVTGFERNRGKGAAVAAGVREARGDYVLLLDVDLSTPLEELPKLAAAVRNGADIAIGSRAIDGALVERGPLHRMVLGKGFNGTVRLLTGLRARDTQCGFKLLPTGPAKRLLARQEFPGFAFDVELLLRASLAGLSIAEVPVVYLHDDRSRVQVVSASLKMLRDVLAMSYRLRVRGEADGPEAIASPEGELVRLSADNPD